MKVTIVTSETNPQIHNMAALLTSRGRKKSDTFLVEGFRAIAEAARAGLAFERVAVQSEMIENEAALELWREPALRDVPVLKTPRGIIKKLSLMDTPQGIVAEVRRPETQQPPVGPGMFIACECLQDPRNLGLLVRTAHAAGAVGVFLGEGSVDPWHPLAIQTSMGSIFHVPVVAGAQMVKLLKDAKKKGVTVWAAAACDGSPLTDVLANAPGSLLVVFGNEGAGLSGDIEKHTDAAISIPMPGGAESLNIAVAAAVFMFSLSMKR